MNWMPVMPRLVGVFAALGVLGAVGILPAEVGAQKKIMTPSGEVITLYPVPRGGEEITTPSGEVVTLYPVIRGGRVFSEYVNGEGKLVRHGRYRITYRNGVRIIDRMYRHGILHGPFVRRSDLNRKVVEGNYENGKLHGRVIRYYPEGPIQSDGVYRQGQLHGPFVRYYLNGQVQEQGVFEAGQREGQFTEYHADGSLSFVATYRAGVMEGPTAVHTEFGSLVARGILSRERIRGDWACFTDDPAVPVRIRTDCDGRYYWECDCP